ncbi:hypothetical protein FB451DRAFT_1302748 [Mycena latifolia]|nr:hypothetical protein FB451DRAFT_1302748 [Mycena latifolia]
MEAGRPTNASETLCNILPILPSPIRRLPAELLVEIFGRCWGSFTPPFEDIIFGRQPPVLETEIARLAHSPLLELSKVCAQWHTIVIGTPSLWGEVQLDGVLWKSYSPIVKVVRLLKSALERGGNFPLTVMISGDGTEPTYSLLLDPLVAQSKRWRIADLSCRPVVFQSLSAVKGRLPRLETLDVQLWLADDDDDEEITSDIFEVCPSLKNLTCGSQIAISTLPLEQLSALNRMELTPEEAAMAISLLSRLPRASTARLQFALDGWIHEPSEVLGLDIVPGTSFITILDMEICEDFHPPHCSQLFGSIFTNLTLPLLENLELNSRTYPRSPLVWPHPQFLSLCARSSFDIHLRSLEIYDVDITHAELLECLSSLPSLEWLAISDHQLVNDGGVDQLLITDSLFAELTMKSDSPCLVPRLRSISCQSLLQFNDNVFLTFVLSRVYGRSDARCFESHISWLPGHKRELDQTVVAQLDELRISRVLVFRFLEAESEWIH